MKQLFPSAHVATVQFMTLMSMTLGAIALSGCASFTAVVPWKHLRQAETDTPQNPVMQVLCLWQPSEGRDPEGVPCRGFAGQIFFLANRSALPIKVTGSVRVYVFDDQGTPEEQARPIHQFEFENEAWNKHLQTSTLGPAYNVFIPYTRRGTHAAVCTVRLRYSPGEGPAIFSDMAKIPLPGRRNTPAEGDEQAKLQREVSESLTRAAHKSITIPLQPGAKPGEAAASSGIVQASHSESCSASPGTCASAAQPAGVNAQDDRLNRLETMLERLLSEQATNRAASTSPAGVPTTSYNGPSERIRWDGHSTEVLTSTGAQPSQAARDSLRLKAAKGSGSALTTHPAYEHTDEGGHPVASAAVRVARHPLADEPGSGLATIEASDLPTEEY